MINQNILINILFQLFNECWYTLGTPKHWQLSHLNHLYKGKSSKTDPNNFGGIRLTSCVMKVITSTIKNRLYNCVENMIRLTTWF